MTKPLVLLIWEQIKEPSVVFPKAICGGSFRGVAGGIM
jgi:hypothetical protein